jgi:hypothetical protein
MYVWLFVFGHFSLGHYIVCSLLIYIFWLHLQYLHVCMIVTDKQSYIHVGTEGVIRRCKSKENRQCNGLKKNDHRQTIIHTCRYWRCNRHYIVCSLLIYIFWLHLQYLHVCMIVCLWSFFFRPLHCLFSFDLHLLILKKNDQRQTIIHTCRYWRCNQKM